MDELTTDIRYTIVPDELVRDARIDGYAKLVYTCIATHVSKDQPVAWPGRDRIMKLSGFKKQVVDRAVKELEEHGWVTVKRKIGSVNRYHVNQSATRTSPRDGQGVSARRTGTSPRDGHEGKPLKVNQEGERDAHKIPHAITKQPMNPDTYSALVTSYGKQTVDDYFERIADYCAAKGKRYKDHAATARNWLKRDNAPKLSLADRGRTCPDCGYVSYSTESFCVNCGRDFD